MIYSFLFSCRVCKTIYKDMHAANASNSQRRCILGREEMGYRQGEAVVVPVGGEAVVVGRTASSPAAGNRVCGLARSAAAI
jgi:hypothetical protein